MFARSYVMFPGKQEPFFRRSCALPACPPEKRTTLQVRGVPYSFSHGDHARAVTLTLILSRMARKAPRLFGRKSPGKQVMEEKLGHVLRNPLEEVRLSLLEIRGEPHVELRVYRRAAPTEASALPSTEGVAIPVNVLPDLVRVLTQARDSLTKQGRIFVPAPTEARVMERGELITEHLGDRHAGQAGRQYPRVAMNVPVECRLLDPGSIWAGKPVTGEVKDISLGGAQVWLPKCFPRFRQIEVVMMIEGAPFRARAEIVGTDLMKTKKGQESCRHNLRWVVMDASAKAALSKVISAEAHDGGDSPG